MPHTNLFAATGTQVFNSLPHNQLEGNIKGYRESEKRAQSTRSEISEVTSH
jgi:hypothetical protein